jgi:putative transposase
LRRFSGVGELEVVKSCKIPVDAPKDLIDSYFEVKGRSLEAVPNHVELDGEARLDFKNDDRKKLRDELLKGWRYSKHYVDSAINSVIGLVKGWITLYNRGRAEKLPEITKRRFTSKYALQLQGWGLKDRH